MNKFLFYQFFNLRIHLDEWSPILQYSPDLPVSQTACWTCPKRITNIYWYGYILKNTSFLHKAQNICGKEQSLVHILDGTQGERANASFKINFN